MGTKFIIPSHIEKSQWNLDNLFLAVRYRLAVDAVVVTATRIKAGGQLDTCVLKIAFC